MKDLLTSLEAAVEVGKSIDYLHGLIRGKRIKSPLKLAGRLWWSPADVERVRAAMAIDRRKREFRHLPAPVGA